jgi:hypothetical protein
MTEAQENIRESLITTLMFLASETKQQEFAAKVPYASYQGEFACWWFDTFFPEEPGASEMFTPRQLVALNSFSATFDDCLKVVGNETFTIEQLQALTVWKGLIARARVALLEINDAI